MQTNDILCFQEKTIRILEVTGESCLVIPCGHPTVLPRWVSQESLSVWEKGDIRAEGKDLSPEGKALMHKRFTMICPILPVIGNKNERNLRIQAAAKEHGVSRQTIIKYLSLYLQGQNIESLAPKQKKERRELTRYERDIRWALNRYYYNSRKNSLKTAYVMMLKEKYCDEAGILAREYPSFYQFRYFYRKTRKMSNYYISREGLTNYQRNHRPCVGGGVQEYAPNVGTGMMDATVCDIYLVDEAGNVAGRPVLTACIDAYSGLCCGYALTWEGGAYSLNQLLLNMIADKAKHCQKHGICIEKSDWPSHALPGRMVTDMGKEYVSDTFSQITELGITIVNLPAYRPEQKGPVEKFFDVIQGYYKKHLKGKGIVESDYKERGAHDYRLDACLTMEDFEKVVLHCILFYNSKRVRSDFPFSEEMLDAGLKPCPNAIWQWDAGHGYANLIETDKENLILHLLPRTRGNFSRFGLKVNKMRYHNAGYTEQYLTGGNITVTYNPDDATYVWAVENGRFVQFELIESRWRDMALDQVERVNQKQMELLKSAEKEKLQSEINLEGSIRIIAEQNNYQERRPKDLIGMGMTKQRVTILSHKDMVKEG